MDNPVRGPYSSAPTKAETACAVEAIGHLRHMLGRITASLAAAKHTARTLLNHSHALPGGVPREAAVAFAKLRLEVAHQDALTLETLRAIVAAVPVPEVQLITRCASSDGKPPEEGAWQGAGDAPNDNPADATPSA